MSLLVDDPPRAPARGRSATWGPLAGAGAAVVAAAVGLAVLAAVTVLLWSAGPHPGEGLGAAPFRAAAAWWLLAQHADATVPAGTIGLAPGALLAAVAFLNIRTAGWAARVAGVSEVGAAVAVAAGFVAAHAVLAVAAAGFGTGAGPAVAPGEALRAGTVFAAVTAGIGVATQVDLVYALAARLGRRLRPALAAARAGLAVLLAGGAAAVGLSLAFHHGRTAETFGAVGGGVSGALGLLALCLAFLPNAVLWAVGLASGPGFALGAGAGADLAGVQAGALPSFPLLGALPAQGGLGPYAWLLAAVPVAAGATVGWAARPAGGPRGWGEALAFPVGAAVGVAAAAGALAQLAAGGAGGRLAPLGPSGLAVGLALAAELAGAAVLVAAVRHGRQRRRAARAAGAAPVVVAVPTLPAARPRPEALTDQTVEADVPSEELADRPPASAAVEDVDDAVPGVDGGGAVGDAVAEGAGVVSLEHPHRGGGPEGAEDEGDDPEA